MDQAPLLREVPAKFHKIGSRQILQYKKYRTYITNPDMDCIKLEVATCKFGDQMTDG